MSAVMERRTTIAEPLPALVRASRGSESSTFEGASFAYGACRSLPPTHSLSRELGMYMLMEKLNSYCFLDENWDGYGGEPATYASWSSAIEFVNALPIRFDLPVPMLAGDGEISLFWKKNGRYLEVSFPGDNTYHFIFQDRNEQFASTDIPFKENRLDLTSELLAYLSRI